MDRHKDLCGIFIAEDTLAQEIHDRMTSSPGSGRMWSQEKTDE
jgi:hypothetical protein